MFTKVNILPIVRAHFKTLRNDATKRRSIGDLILQIFVPALSILACIWPLSVDLESKYSNLLAALAIIFGFAFAAAIFIFQLRMQMAEMQVLSRKSPVAEIAPQIDSSAPVLVNELFSNCLYAVLVSGATVLWTGLVDGLSLPVWCDYIIVGLIAHLVIVLLMCFKRINAAYMRVANLKR